ncbi:MAG: hypothetical protein Q7S40_04915 [Opitutaceae bacterium]|nr:hypothetical protein [Opitutaceae bacterium]
MHRLIRERREVSFDEVYAVGMRFPTVQLSALRKWTDEVGDIVNLGEREKVGKPGANHRIKFRDGSSVTGEFRF